ncbi:hypothetical protein, partial [Gluconobacter oxydans]|uniref:hypothetical protein n=1 Tax=Gluconobacter oxydans TaxID=442 RepID=UPI0039E814BD
QILDATLVAAPKQRNTNAAQWARSCDFGHVEERSGNTAFNRTIRQVFDGLIDGFKRSVNSHS